MGRDDNRRSFGSRNDQGGSRGGDRGGNYGSRGGFGGGSSGGFSSGPRESHKATCADCGNECQVPFKPTEGRPVYCRDCFAKHKPKRF